jgi:capsular exopolysaccharide synthesis family protein
VNTLHENDSVEPPDPRPGPAPRNPVQIVWRRKSLVLLGLVVGLVGGVIFQSQRAPVYQTGAQVLVVKKRADVLPIPGNDAANSYYDDYISTHLVLIKSPLIVGRAVKKHDLGALPSFAGQGDPTAAIMGSITAARDGKEWSNTSIVNLSYRGPVADDCPVVLGAVIDSYKDFLDETYRNVSDNTLDLIKNASKLLSNDLKEKRENYREFREKNSLTIEAAPKDGVSPTKARLGELEARRLSLLVRSAEIEDRLKAVENAREQGTARELVLALATPSAEKPGAPAGPSALRAELLPLMLQEQALLETYGADYPDVVAVRRKIKMTRELHAGVAAEQRGSDAPDPVEAYVKELKQEQANVELTRQSLARLADEEQEKSKDLRRYEDKDEDFRTEISQTQALWDQTIKRLQEINVVRDFGGYNVQTISSPGPGGKIGTPAMQTLLAGAVLGLLLGGGLAYLADVADKSFRSPEEIRHRLGLPVVAHVPLLEEEGAPSSPEAPQLERSLAAYHRPTSPEAEAYRGLRTALYFSTRGELHKVIQITSPNMGDGKTTLAANLGIAIAQSGKRVVIVDADMRRPRLHALFGVLPEAGLSSVIAGDAQLSAAVADTGIERLSLLACGPRPANPAELLSLPRFEQVLAELRDQFDFVIVDTPPLLAVTDPCVVASKVDGVLMAVRLGKNERPAAERAREILFALHANVLGVIVNGVGAGPGNYGYEHYSYKYGYGGQYEAAAGAANGHTTAAAVRKKRRRKSGGWLSRWVR